MFPRSAARSRFDQAFAQQRAPALDFPPDWSGISSSTVAAPSQAILTVDWPTPAITMSRACATGIEVSPLSHSLRTLFVASLLPLAAAARAQDAPKPNPFKVLSIFQEVVKPGQNAAHANHEVGWPTALSKAGSTNHYLALVSTTGNNDALYITAYPSFTALDATQKSQSQLPGLNAANERLAAKDGDFLVRTHGSLAVQSDSLTIGTPASLEKVHGFFVRTSVLKFGQSDEYKEYIRIVQEGYRKAGLDPHILTYEILAGASAPTYITFRGFASIAEVDAWGPMGDKMAATLTAEQRARLTTLAQSAFTSRDGEFYMLDAKQSFPGSDLVAADPSFWKENPVALAANAKKATVKQAGAPKAEKKE